MNDAGRARSGPGPRPGPRRRADARWGLAARGALVEAGGPPIGAQLVGARACLGRHSAEAVRRRRGGAVGSGDRRRWTAPINAVPPEIERAVIQIMTYLVENEQAALIIPARLLSQLHPHYREVMQLLATQAATRRGTWRCSPGAGCCRAAARHLLAGGRASLATLLNEPDFTTASFLLSVLGEGTFVDLLRFLHAHARDPVTADVTRLALRDEARHVAFGVAHTAHLAGSDPAYLGTLRRSVERRHAALQDTAGLNAEVFDSLVLLAARGSPPRSGAAGRPSAICRPGWTRAAQAGGGVRAAHPQLHVIASASTVDGTHPRRAEPDRDRAIGNAHPRDIMRMPGERSHVRSASPPSHPHD